VSSAREKFRRTLSISTSITSRTTVRLPWIATLPQLRGNGERLEDRRFQDRAITDLNLAKLPGYKQYDEGIKADYFVKNPDGSEYVGKVWPGDSVFPDFTRAAARQWWGTLYSDFVKTGIRGFWNDMNDRPSLNVPTKRCRWIPSTTSKAARLLIARSTTS
jgi:alpha-glucosidase (family GH31 glycosyl hydrolase)